MGEIFSPILYLQKAGYEERLRELVIILGTPDKVPDLEVTPVVVGRCARAFRKRGVYVPGCPPHGIAIAEAACVALGLDATQVRAAIERLHDF